MYKIFSVLNMKLINIQTVTLNVIRMRKVNLPICFSRMDDAMFVYV